MSESAPLPTLFCKLVAGYTPQGATFGVDYRASETPFGLETAEQLRHYGEKELRGALTRDLTPLLNTTRFQDAYGYTQEPEEKHRIRRKRRGFAERWPRVVKSVLNYGVGVPEGSSHEGDDFRARRDVMIAAITTYEPRVEPRTLRIETPKAVKMVGAVAPFYINVDISKALQNLSFRIRAGLDKVEGSVKLEASGE